MIGEEPGKLPVSISTHFSPNNNLYLDTTSGDKLPSAFLKIPPNCERPTCTFDIQLLSFKEAKVAIIEPKAPPEEVADVDVLEVVSGAISVPANLALSCSVVVPNTSGT